MRATKTGEGEPVVASIRGRRIAVLAAVLLPVAAAAVLAAWGWRGASGLVGSAAGVAAGAAIVAVGQVLRAKVRAASGPATVTLMLGSVCATFGLFAVLALIVALAAREAAAQVLLPALAVYLAASFADVFLVRDRSDV